MVSDELEQLANKWDSVDGESDPIEKPEHKSEQPEVVTVETSDDAGELAGFVVGALGGVLKIVEPRLEIDGQPEAARDECGAVVEKYGLHQGGAGNALGFKPEITAGLFLGRYLKIIIKQFKYWREHDRQKKEGDQENGNKREYRPTEPAQAVSSAQRVRQEPDTKTF